jgi:hypothetical protein
MAKKSKNHAKQPRAIAIPTTDKTPRATTFPDEASRPEFRADRMDIGGPWDWNMLAAKHLQDFLKKLLEVQKLSWQILREKHSHLVDINKIIPEAQKRLQKIGQDDLDQLYSLSLSGRLRVWGIKDGNIFWLLWWDPQHSICPSLKKHT